MKLRFQAHTHPSSGDFKKLFDIPEALEGSTGVRELSAWSDETLYLPASFSDIDDIDWVKVLLGDKTIDEFEPVRKDEPAGRPSTITLTGPQRNGLLEGIGIAPKNYPNHKQGAFDWKWGAENALPSLGLADLGSIRAEYELHNDQTVGGTFTVTVDGDTTEALDFDVSAAGLEGSVPADTGIQGLSTVNDVAVSGEGTSDDPWVITFYDPPSPSSVSVTDANGLTSTLDQTVAGALDPSPITISKPVDAGAGSEDEHGSYGDPAIEVATDNLDTDADWALLVNAESRFAGSQLIVNVTPGETYSASIRVKPGTTGTFKFVFRDIFGNHIDQDGGDLTAGSYQELSIDGMVIPAGVDQVIMRIAAVDDTPANIDSFHVNWQHAELITGDPEATFTQIVRELLEASQARGAGTFLELDATDAADTLGTALTPTSFTQFVGDNYNLSHTMGEGKRLKYQWRVMPAADAQVITPAGTTTHVLQVFYVSADEIEDKTPFPGVSVLVGSDVKAAQKVTRRPEFTVAIGLGTGSVSVKDDRSASFGGRKIEKIFDVEHLGTEAAVTEYLDARFAEQEKNLTALTATVLGSAPKVPGVDFGEGSKIWWHFPGILDKEARPVKRFSWTHKGVAEFQLQGSRVLTRDEVLAVSLDRILRQPTRRRDQKKAPSPSSLIGGGGQQTGAHIHVMRATTQSIGTTAEEITWTAANGTHPAKNFAAPSFPTSEITIQEPGYYDIEVAFTLAAGYTRGGSVSVLRNGSLVVWPPSVDTDIWTTDKARRFAGTAKGVELLSGDTISVEVAHNSGSAVDLEWAQLSIELVDRIIQRDPWDLIFPADNWGVTWDGSNWWTTDNADNAATALFKRSESGAVVASYPNYDVGGTPPKARGVVSAASFLWATGNDELVYKLDPADGTTDSTWSTGGTGLSVGGIGYDGTNLFVPELDTDEIREFNTAGTLQDTHSFPAGRELRDITWDGTGWWATLSGSSTIIRMDASFAEQQAMAGPTSQNEGCHYKDGFLYVMTPSGLYRRAV